MGEQIVSQDFNEVIEPIAEEIEQTANDILGEQKSIPLDGLLGVEISTDPDITPLANTTLSCTNPTCDKCSGNCNQ